MNRRYDRSLRGGFTLVELMIAIALTIILIGIMAFVFTQSRLVVLETDLRLRNFRGAQFATELIGTDIEHIYPVARADTGLMLEKNIYFSAGNVDFRADRIRFTTFRDLPGTNDRTFTSVEYRLDGIGNLSNPILRRVAQDVTFGAGAPTFGALQESELAENVIDFRVEYARDEADPVAAGPNRLRPTFRDADGPGAGTARGDFFFYTSPNPAVPDGTLVNANLEARLDVPDNATATGKSVFDFVRPYAVVRISGVNVPLAEYTIKKIDHAPANDPVRVHLVETPPAIGNSPVVYTAFAYPPAIRVTVRTTARGTPRGSLVQTYWLK